MRIVIVGAGGVGGYFGGRLAEAGADVIISSRHENELQKALDQILAGTGRRGAYVVADMSKRDDVRRLRRPRWTRWAASTS